MSKVISIHVLEPAPLANPEAFDRLMRESADAFQGVNTDGWQTYIVRGDRGVRKGRYAVIHIFDSSEVRNRYFPIEDGKPSEEAERIFRDFTLAYEELDKGWGELVREDDSDYTDYVVVDQ